MGKRLAVCVPYRNRKAHLDVFVPYLSGYLNKRNIEHKIFICNQADAKPFNRGMMKNIAFKEACEEGFDYFAFHDVDLLPADESCDYSFPGKHPIHLCVFKSDEDFKLSYPQYFGGCVLFTREQFETVNGYYNGYWGWGYEDDDLFYRVTRKGLADVGFAKQEIRNKKVVCFDNNRAHIEVMKNYFDRSMDDTGFSLFALLKPESTEIRNYLIGDKFNFFEVPFYFAGYRDILAYNKYENITVKLYNKAFRSNVLYARHPKNEWMMLLLTVDPAQKRIELYINTMDNKETCNDARSVSYKTSLLSIADKRQIIGNKRRLFIPRNLPFRGEVAEISLWNHVFTAGDVRRKFDNIYEELFRDKIVFSFDFEETDNNLTPDKGAHGNHGILHDCSIKDVALLKIKTHTKPYRRCGRFNCLPHTNEGVRRKRLFEKYHIRLRKDASVNEKIFKVHVLGNTINPDDYGLNSLSYGIKNKRRVFGSHTMLDVECGTTLVSGG
jgi:hypothetical protein